MKFRKFLKEHIGKDIEIDFIGLSSFPKKCKLVSFDVIGLAVNYGGGIVYHPFGTIFRVREVS